MLVGAALLFGACEGAGHEAELPPDFARYAEQANVPAEHRQGARLFQELCSECHGPAGTGSERGPPLMHPYYRPHHHSDAAFHLAVTRGVAAHHWSFGDMPPVDVGERAEVDRVVGYVRWLQRRAGMY